MCVHCVCHINVSVVAQWGLSKNYERCSASVCYEHDDCTIIACHHGSAYEAKATVTTASFMLLYTLAFPG